MAIPVETRLYELSGVDLPSTGLFTAADLDAVFSADDIAYEVAPSSGEVERRLLQAQQTRYLASDLSTELAKGQVGPLALVSRSYTLALTAGQVTAVYGGAVSSSDLTAAGYVDLESDGRHWARSGTASFTAAAFYQPSAATDPFGNTYEVTYDDALAVVGSEDPLGNTQSLTIDYRTLMPSTVTDENGNVTAVATDALGRVVAIAEQGKPGGGEGDDLTDPPSTATVTFSYDLDRWQDEQTPAVAIVRARETHGESQTRWLEQRSYTDGLGREVMTKVMAEPGDAPKRDTNGDLVFTGSPPELVYEHTNNRWVGTGRTVFDNKGAPVKQYEPFFSATPDYESEADVAESGVTPIIHRDPLGRVVRVDLPDGTETQVVFDAWKQTHYDAGDLVVGSAWYDAAANGTTAQQRAATLSAAYDDTPTTVHLDALGRSVLSVEDGGTSIGSLQTRMAYDLEGQLLSVTDPRGLNAETNTYDVAGRLIKRFSCDAGTQKVFYDCTSQPVLSITARGLTVRHSRDALLRPVATTVDDGNDVILTERIVYGEVHPDAVDYNLRGKPYLSYDGVGESKIDGYDFKGNALSTTRRFAVEYAPEHDELDWSALDGLEDLEDIADAVAELLEETSYTTESTYDALDRVVTQTTPDASVTTTTYDAGGGIETIEVEIRGEGEPQLVLADLDTDARGQRLREVLGDEAVVRSYTYDDKTFRLVRLVSERQDDSAVLQDLRYTYDVTGNIVEIEDAADTEVYFDVTPVSGDRQYVYDPLYRLVESTGRKHPGQQPIANSSSMFGQVPHPNDPTGLERYKESYSYDDNGNLTEMKQTLCSTPWTRTYEIDEDTNRLLSHNRPTSPDPYSYAYDEAGNMTEMAHISAMTYTSAEQLASADLGGGGVAYYGYAGGERARKVIDHESWTERCLYLGGWELYVRDNGSLGIERETLHVYEGGRRIALIETKTGEGGEAIEEPVSLLRMQLDDHLGSACVEVDEAGAVIGFEEYFPYGGTSFRASDASVEVSARRYRYIGKERDDETGLSYHSARYYAAWLGRWTTSDPAGLVDGPGTYSYCRGDPVGASDPRGLDSFEQGNKAPRKNLGEGLCISSEGCASEPGNTSATAPRRGSSPQPGKGVYIPPKSKPSSFMHIPQGWATRQKQAAEFELRDKKNGHLSRVGLAVLWLAVWPLATAEEFVGRATLNTPNTVVNAGTSMGEDLAKARLWGKAGETGEALAALGSGFQHGLEGFAAAGTIAAPGNWRTTTRLRVPNGRPGVLALGRGPQIQTTDAALGMYEHGLTDFARSKGALHSDQWPGVLHPRSFKSFADAFSVAMNKVLRSGGRIRFALDGLRVGEAMSQAATRYPTGSYTVWELQQVVRNRRWYTATKFYMKGKKLSPGQVKKLGIRFLGTR